MVKLSICEFDIHSDLTEETTTSLQPTPRSYFFALPVTGTDTGYITYTNRTDDDGSWDYRTHEPHREVYLNCRLYLDDAEWTPNEPVLFELELECCNLTGGY